MNGSIGSWGLLSVHEHCYDLVTGNKEESSTATTTVQIHE